MADWISNKGMMKKFFIRIFIYFILFFLIMNNLYLIGIYNHRFKWLMTYSEVSKEMRFNLIMSIWISVVIGGTEMIREIIKKKRVKKEIK